MKEKTITQLGSNWNNWSNAGTFYWNLNNSVSNRNRNIRGHLIFAKKIQPDVMSGYFHVYVLSTLSLDKTEK